MYYKNLLNIRRGDLVLEVGPGSMPYWRSDVLADKFDNSDVVPAGNFGGGKQKTYNRPFFKIENNRLPFRDKSVDLLICSHVLEHVPASEVPEFLRELCRVSDRVYIEFPSALYEFIRDIEGHVNILAIDGDELVYIDKGLMAPYAGEFSQYMQKTFERYPEKPMLFCARVFTNGKIQPEEFTDASAFLKRISNIRYLASPPSFFCRTLNYVQNRLCRNRRLSPKKMARVNAALAN